MKITMDITGIDSKVVVIIPDDPNVTKEEAENIAIEAVCSIKENDIDIEESVRTYTMRYKCYNCKREFVKKIPFGKNAYDAGGDCPICGAKSHPEDAYNRNVHQIITGE